MVRQEDSQIEIVDQLSSKEWRLNNLYWIQDKRGKRVKFKMNASQKKFFDEMWYMNLILKARQRGFTTMIELYILDECIFNSDVTGGVIAHSREDVAKIFDKKIRYPYNNLHDDIKIGIQSKSESKTEMKFENNSSISVGTSMRSGTLQYLHVSEFGKICAKYPEKAREVVTGAFETVQIGEMIFVESTAEGRSGYFYDYCQDAQKLGLMISAGERELSKLDFKFHFFAWWEDEENVSDTPIPISQRFRDYFSKLETDTGIKLTDKQKYWYIQKEQKLQEDMKRENPSTPKEAFEQSLKGAYFSAQFEKIYKEGRITSVKAKDSIIVDTWWDLGMNDTNCIWFTQDIGREIHVIDYYENSGEGFAHYANILDGKKYRYGRHVGPHDLSVRELGTGKSRKDSALEYGIRFDRVPRISNKLDSIEQARKILDVCWFDEEKCDKGIRRLEGYKKEWDENTGTYKNRPCHDENSNGADAFQTLAMGHSFNKNKNTKTELKRSNYVW